MSWSPSSKACLSFLIVATPVAIMLIRRLLRTSPKAVTVQQDEEVPKDERRPETEEQQRSSTPGAVGRNVAPSTPRNPSRGSSSSSSALERRSNHSVPPSPSVTPGPTRISDFQTWKDAIIGVEFKFASAAWRLISEQRQFPNVHLTFSKIVGSEEFTVSIDQLEAQSDDENALQREMRFPSDTEIEVLQRTYAKDCQDRLSLSGCTVLASTNEKSEIKAQMTHGCSERQCSRTSLLTLLSSNSDLVTRSLPAFEFALQLDTSFRYGTTVIVAHNFRRGVLCSITHLSDTRGKRLAIPVPLQEFLKTLTFHPPEPSPSFVLVSEPKLGVGLRLPPGFGRDTTQAGSESKEVNLAQAAKNRRDAQLRKPQQRPRLSSASRSVQLSERQTFDGSMIASISTRDVQCLIRYEQALALPFSEYVDDLASACVNRLCGKACESRNDTDGTIRLRSWSHPLPGGTDQVHGVIGLETLTRFERPTHVAVFLLQIPSTLSRERPWEIISVVFSSPETVSRSRFSAMCIASVETLSLNNQSGQEPKVLFNAERHCCRFPLLPGTRVIEPALGDPLAVILSSASCITVRSSGCPSSVELTEAPKPASYDVEVVALDTSLGDLPPPRLTFGPTQVTRLWHSTSYATMWRRWTVSQAVEAAAALLPSERHRNVRVSHRPLLETELPLRKAGCSWFGLWISVASAEKATDERDIYEYNPYTVPTSIDHGLIERHYWSLVVVDSGV